MKLRQTITLSQYCLIGLILIISTNIFAQSQAINSQVAGLSKERLARLDAFLDSEIVAGRIPGAVSLIYRKIFWTNRPRFFSRKNF